MSGIGIGFGAFIGFALSVAATVLLFIKVIPSKYDGTFDKKPLQILHDYFNFKKLYLESILKIIFAFVSILCVVGGLSVGIIGNALSFIGGFFDAIRYEYFDVLIGTTFATFFGGIAVAIVGPIVLRLAYEGIMMFILLVKNVIEINNKMKSNVENNTTVENKFDEVNVVTEVVE